VVEISAQLFAPSLDEELRIKLNCFHLSDGGESDDNPANHDSVARYSVMLEGPAITQELRPEVPLLCPIRFQTLSSFFISNDRPAVLLSEQIESTSVDKGITARRVPWPVREIQWDCEREFKCRARSEEIRLNAIKSRRIGSDVVLNCCPHVFRSFWMLFLSNDKITPLGGEGCVCAAESSIGICVIEEYRFVEGFEGGAEDRAGVEVDGYVGGPEAEDVFVPELLLTGPEAVNHGRVDICGEDGFGGHSESRVGTRGLRGVEVRVAAGDTFFRRILAMATSSRSESSDRSLKFPSGAWPIRVDLRSNSCTAVQSFRWRKSSITFDIGFFSFHSVDVVREQICDNLTDRSVLGFVQGGIPVESIEPGNQGRGEAYLLGNVGFGCAFGHGWMGGRKGADGAVIGLIIAPNA
jgi:hypothetical protein